MDSADAAYVAAAAFSCWSALLPTVAIESFFSWLYYRENSVQSGDNCFYCHQ